jgi:hypothetical protein
LPIVRLLLVIFLAISSAIAENPRPTDAEAPIGAATEANSPSASSTTAPTTTAYTPAAAQPASLPDAPTPRKARVPGRVIDKKFIAVVAALGGAETLRFTTHKLVLDHEFAAGAPWVASVPPNPHLVAKYGAIFAAEVLVTYELKKPHSWLPGDRVIRKLWWAYPATMAPIHIKNGIRSIRTQAPSCPVAECGEQ